jgi:hypothetical protein
LATFNDVGGIKAVDNYTAEINWGDGTNSAGLIQITGGTNLAVTGSHAYAAEGPYSVIITISDVGGSTATAATTLHVARAGPPPASLDAVADALTHSAEYYSSIIENAYQHFLGRAADAAGLANWVTAMQNGLTDEQLEAGFIGSPEYIQDHGGTHAAWVVGLYRDLLGRDPDPQGLQDWLAALQRGVSPAQIAYGFAASAEREAQRITADYQKFLGRNPEPGSIPGWVDAFLHGASNEDIVAGFVASPEYFQGHYTDLRDWLFSAYQDILGRAPDSAGYDQWLTVL